MPIKTLQTYVKTLARVKHGVMVMNGFIGDPKHIKPTLQFMQSILKKDTQCEEARCAVYPVEIQINPILFRRYAIQRVPAFIWENEPQDTFCEADLTQLPKSQSLVLEGDADLIYVLNELHRHNRSTELYQLLRGVES